MDWETFSQKHSRCFGKVWKMDGDHFHSVVSGFIGSRLVMNHLKIICMLDVFQDVVQAAASNDCLELNTRDENNK
jgi:hypothetical protein